MKFLKQMIKEQQTGEKKMGNMWSSYSEKAMEHFKSPRNVGEIEKPERR